MLRSALTIALLLIALLIVASSIVVAPGLLVLGESSLVAALVQWCVLGLGVLVVVVTMLYDKTFGNDILD
jgi:hypothetical protein